MASPSPPSSSSYLRHLPDLGTLVEHLIAVKRSLSSTAQVYRANELVFQARGQVEDIAVAAARDEFLRKAVLKQVGVVARMQRALEKIKARGEGEFKQILTALDTADDAVNDALQQLREIQIDPHLQAQLATDNPIKAPGPPAGSSKDSSKGSLKADTGHQSRPPSQPKDQTQTLYALVSPTPLETIRSQIRQHIDAITAATASITSVINTLASHTTTVHRTLDSPEDDAESQHISLEKSAIREIFTTLEDKASESAQSLQSLITHYDLCVKAVRNTEGGGEAVSTHDGVEGERLDVQGDEPLISEEERVELLAVISKDAGEVDDVVSEIDDAGREMEVLSGELSEHLLYLQSESQRLDKAKRLLEACAPELKGCGRAGEVFWRTMEGELEGIREGLRGLEEVGRGFGGFREGYGRMVGELGRRGEFERRMGRMYEDEARKRDEFLEEWGHTLPSDFLPLLQGDPRDLQRQQAD